MKYIIQLEGEHLRELKQALFDSIQKRQELIQWSIKNGLEKELFWLSKGIVVSEEILEKIKEAEQK